MARSSGLKTWVLGLALVVLFCLAAPAPAQEAAKPGNAKKAEPAAAAPAPAPEAAKSMTVWQQVWNAGMIEYVIILVSIAATTLIIDNMWKIRVATAMPPDIVAESQKLMKERAYNDVLTMCQSKPSYFSNVLQSGLLKLRHDFSAVQEAVNDAIDKGAAAMHSRINTLSFLAKISPMLGLLGTVIGMISAFGNIARASALNKPELLAQGVSQALITTATGLIVALPVMLFYFILRDRVNRIVLQVESTVSDMLEPFRPTRKG
ncbi:MAG: MotA/TolQ/ExbB proton channel family protein [Planctomycetes bacterium]|nr:MotA/TolQ/ExbB proton channel family protein [Planctomycetota bacterium]